MKRAKKLTLPSCLLIAISFGYQWAAAQSSGMPEAVSGVIDLRQQDLSGDPVALNGQWLFFWNRLLSPSDSLPAPSYLNFPSLWNKGSLPGVPVSAQGYATYRLTVLLPRSRPGLALQVPDLYSSYALYVNGELVARNGRPGKTPAEATPFWTTRT